MVTLSFNKMDIFDIKEINRKLETLYGKSVHVDLPNYRVSFSEDQLEKRAGLKNAIISGTNIVLRQEDGIHDVQKYPWLDNQWIIERLIPNMHQDVSESSYIYECLYAFKPYMPCPPWRAIEFFMKHYFLVCNIAHQPRTKEEAWAREEKRIEEEKLKVRNILDSDGR